MYPIDAIHQHPGLLKIPPEIRTSDELISNKKHIVQLYKTPRFNQFENFIGPFLMKDEAYTFGDFLEHLKKVMKSECRMLDYHGEDKFMSLVFPMDDMDIFFLYITFEKQRRETSANRTYQWELISDDIKKNIIGSRAKYRRHAYFTCECVWTS